MKKIKFLALMMLAGSLVFTSCTKDDEDTAASALPTVTFQGGNNSLEFDGTAGIDVNVDFTAEAKVSTFKLTFLGDSLVDLTSTYGNETSGSYRFQRSTTQITADLLAGSGTVEYVFTLVDKDQNARNATFTVTTASQAGAIDSYTAVLMGAQSSSSGSYYDVSANTVYNQSGADASPALIDFVHYYGSTNASTICAPNDATVGGGTGNLSLCASWATKNATLFGTVTGVDFSAISDDTEIVANESSATSSISNQLAVGTVVEFKTADDKYGMFKVVSVDTDASGSITIDVKVQQ